MIREKKMKITNIIFLVLVILLVSCNRIKENINNVLDVQDNTNKIMYVNASSGLRVRSLPSMDGEVIGVLDFFTKVSILKEDDEKITINDIEGKWVYINSPIEGWVFDGYLVATNTQFTTDSNGIVWIVEPTLDYDNVYYCSMCGYTANSFNYIIDRITGRIKSRHDGHGGPGYIEWLYDSQNRMFGYYSYGWEEDVMIYPVNQFSARFPSDVNTLKFVRQVDSANIIAEEHEWEGKSYKLGERYENSKFAIAYGSTILTEFIYDKPDNLSQSLTYLHTIPVSRDGKWGFINTRGNITVPLIFDHAASYDGETAFVKINGRYGIIDVRR